MVDLVPSTFWRFPAIKSFWEEDEDWGLNQSAPSGISIYEDDKHVYVDTALPGIDPKDVEVTFDKGVVWIKGESKVEEKDKKYYRKAASSFSYRVAIPGDVDLSVEPVATAKNGIMTVAFAKSPKSQPKKITVKA